VQREHHAREEHIALGEWEGRVGGESGASDQRTDQQGRDFPIPPTDEK
jgi:hypothetical protein